MTEPLWRLKDFVDALDGELFGEPGDIAGLSIDSRTVNAGDAFFALPGENFDGHDYAAGAISDGAALSVVQRDRWDAGLKETFSGLSAVIVDDTLEALERLGIAARARTDAKIVAVTGSAGKTTTKEMLRAVFSGLGKTHAAVSSFNNHIGVPLTLARMPADTDYGIFEIGMNHAGEISPLSKMVRPDVAIITLVDAVHLEAFDSVEGIAYAKAEIFDGLSESGTAILNYDNPWFGLLEREAVKTGNRKVLKFGGKDGSDIRMTRISAGEQCSVLVADVCGTPITYKVGSPGRHLAQNSLAVMAAFQALGGDIVHGAITLAGFSPVKGRGQRHTLEAGDGNILLIDESYNANPASVAAALDVLAEEKRQTKRRVIAVLGDMLELGPTGAQRHADLSHAVLTGNIDQVYCVGPLMKNLFDALPSTARGYWSEKSATLAAPLVQAVRAGDIVMIKGSLGMKMAVLVEKLKEAFPSAPEAA